MSSCNSSPLGSWLASAGGGFNSKLEFRKDAFGTSIYAAQPLPAGEAAVSCPFSLAITPSSALRCVSALLQPSAPTASNHHLMTLYLALHLVYPTATELPNDLKLEHYPYVETLPRPDEMRTPCYYTDEELRLLEGTNLVGATRDRLQGWKEEWEELKVLLGDKETAEKLSWDSFLWACTILSSRAFPSSLIDGPSADSTPVLFPGVDTLNHRLGAKASWITDVNEPAVREPKGKLAIVLDEGVEKDQQAFNTYGPKPNEELLLGYGFTTPTNPSDLVALKLSLPPSSSWLIDLPTTLSALGISDLRHFVPRSGEIPAALLAQMRLFMASDEDVEAFNVNGKGGSVAWEEVLGFLGWENELDVLDALQGMLEMKLGGLKRGERAAIEVDDNQVRSGIRENVDEYRRGQIDVLEAALVWRQERFEETVGKAKEAGLDFMMEDVDEEDEEE